MKHFNNYIINKSNLINNVNIVKQQIGEKVFLCAMLKANAYGHGLKHVHYILKGKVDFFGVATIKEAQTIRQWDKKSRILIVGLIDINYVNWCAKNNVSITVNSFFEMQQINKMLKSKNLKIHFKINSGLNRIGFDNKKEFKNAFSLAKRNSLIKIEGVFTHFATKESDEGFIHAQAKVFKGFVNQIDTTDIIVHCCNSYAAINFPEYHYNMVRCGFALYGWLDNGLGFLPVVKIVAKVLKTKKVKKGQTIGYDRTYTAHKDKTIAVVSLGYGDGFDRAFSNKGYVVINGKQAKIVGLICMDVFMVDITNIQGVFAGTDVYVLGGPNDIEADGGITIYDQGRLLSTSPYEVLLKYNHNRMNVIIE